MGLLHEAPPAFSPRTHPLLRSELTRSVPALPRSTWKAAVPGFVPGDGRNSGFRNLLSQPCPVLGPRLLLPPWSPEEVREVSTVLCLPPTVTGPSRSTASLPLCIPFLIPRSPWLELIWKDSKCYYTPDLEA